MYLIIPGYMHQLDLPFTDAPAILEIDLEYCTSVYAGITVKAFGNQSGSISTHTDIDHPAFTTLRNWLASNHYIRIQPNWSNGDVVTAPFYLNNVLFSEGDQFPCASAIKYRLTS